MVNRDPRKQRVPPDAYVGIVEDVGPDCRYVKINQKVVVRRWVYRQHDIDDERIIAYENQILVLDHDRVAPHTVVMKVEDVVKGNSLIIPDMVHERTKQRMKSYSGTVLNSSVPGIRKEMKLWIEKRDRGQYFLNQDTLVFRDEPDSFNGDSPVLAIGEKVPMFQII